MKTVMGWFVSYFFRWLPAATRTGLLPIGTPDRNSPVIVTANFWLTVRRVRKALRGENLWLLIVNTKGINVWCAASGGLFTHNRVIDAVKISLLAGKVDHRQLILPALSAPGVDAGAIRATTGFVARFGPVYAEDIPGYLQSGMKTEAMRHFRFDLRHRADMYLSMNLLVYLPVGITLAAAWPEHLLLFTMIFWSAVAFLYVCIDLIPGKTGWAQALVSAGLWVVGWAGFDWAVYGSPIEHWPWFIALFGIFLLAGIDLAGTASPRRSDFELLIHRAGRRKLGRLVTERELGIVMLDRAACIGCGRCREICPIRVFGELDNENNTTLPDRDACFSCGACVRQCPAGALHHAAVEHACRG